jgi:hypothetical protein
VHYVYTINQSSLFSGIAEWNDPVKWLENDTGTTLKVRIDKESLNE